MLPSQATMSENETRRLAQQAEQARQAKQAEQGMHTGASLETPQGQLASWEPLKPEPPKSAESTAPVPVQQASELPSTDPTAQASASPTARPVLSLDLGPSLSRSIAPPGTSNTISASPASAALYGPSSPLAAFTPGVDANGNPISPIPGMIVGPNGKLRPAILSRKTTHIHSPPMPQPIKNLPTLSGLPGFNVNMAQGQGADGQAQVLGQRTPAGLPRTPGWGGFGMSGTPTGSAPPRTPGGGFPWAMGMGMGDKKDKGKQAMSEEELRKMKRAMVCIQSCFLAGAYLEEGNMVEER
jgi:hypothetical protein